MTIKQYLVIDDKPSDVEYLQSLLDQFPLFQLAGVATSIEEAMEILASRTIDLIFLDVRLMDQSGLTLLKVATLPSVIIVSAYPQYAVDSYEIGRAADFLLKPFSIERLHIALSRAVQVQSRPSHILEGDIIFLKTGRRIQRFHYPSIDYAEAFGIYSKVYVGEQVDLVNERLSSLTELLPARLFMRIHKSYVVNISKITSYDRNNLWIGKTKIPIGISYRPRLQGLLSLFNVRDEPI